ncbi:hypothetical protein L7F22_037029 [Adiantum nelumboides]|nr:hypothetical protein [Adiantum nelumboides]
MATSPEAAMQQMIQQFAVYMQQQQTVQQQYQLQERMRKARPVVTDKLQRFEGRDIPKFCKLYEQSMEDNEIQDREAVDGFHLIVVLELRTRIVELQTQQGTDWSELKQALKEEYFLEDSQRVTKSERVDLIVQAADARLQKSLEQLLEDATGDLGLTSDWKLVLEAVNMIVKRRMRMDKLIVADASDTSDEKSKDKPTSSKHKLEEPVLDDLVKGIQELNLTLEVCVKFLPANALSNCSRKEKGFILSSKPLNVSN